MIFPIKRGRFRIVCVSVWSQTHCCLSFRVSGPTWTSFVWAGCQTRRATVPGLGSETLGPGLGCYRFYRSLVCHLCWLWMGRIIRQAGGGVIFFTVHLKTPRLRKHPCVFFGEIERWGAVCLAGSKSDFGQGGTSNATSLTGDLVKNHLGYNQFTMSGVSVVIEDPQISYGPSCWPRCCGNKLFSRGSCARIPTTCVSRCSCPGGLQPWKGKSPAVNPWLILVYVWFLKKCCGNLEGSNHLRTCDIGHFPI
jgi:hypothetical protein